MDISGIGRKARRWLAAGVGVGCLGMVTTVARAEPIDAALVTLGASCHHPLTLLAGPGDAPWVCVDHRWVLAEGLPTVTLTVQVSDLNRPNDSKPEVNTAQTFVVPFHADVDVLMPNARHELESWWVTPWRVEPVAQGSSVTLRWETQKAENHAVVWDVKVRRGSPVVMDRKTWDDVPGWVTIEVR